MDCRRRKSLPLNQIEVNDFFWNKYTRLVTEQIIPYQWEILNDNIKDAEPSHCIKNFEIAAGLREGRYEGTVFQDTDLAKWLEAVAYSLAYKPDEALEKRADDMIDLIGKAQQKDGYLDTYFIVEEPEKKFCNLREGHELYTAGHFMEAAVAYYQVTGKKKFIDIMCRVADLLCEIFHKKEYENAVPGHEEVEIGLLRLYGVTGKKEYLMLAKEFVDRRGVEPNYLIHESEKDGWIDIFKDVNPFFPEYSQCHKPVREQDTAEGHAVRAVYLYCAMADLAYEFQDEELLTACEKLYDNITKKRMYITGGIGSSGAYERFTTDYDLPNNSNYAESCASIGLALFCRRMLSITGEEKYAETMECALMNTVTAGIALDGKSFFYVNPLEVWPDSCMEYTSMAHVKPVRQKWFGCACCPPNIARTLASLGEYIVFQEQNDFWINMFVAGKVKTSFSGIPAMVTIESGFPFEGKVTIEMVAEETVTGNIMLRIPSYAKNVSLISDGKVICTKSGSYMKIPFSEKKAKIHMTFEMPAHFVYANPKVRADAGKVAVKKGPLVYCLEEVDNGTNLSNIFVDTSVEPKESFEKNLLGGTEIVKISGKRMAEREWKEDVLYGEWNISLEEVELKMVPYCYWGNRRTGEMQTWMKALQKQ
ncbi:MAG: glycoside hydrolase family 127 protein [Roseburia sp.]